MNWGYWGSVGIVAEESYRKRMEQADIGSIEPSDGMKALETFIVGICKSNRIYKDIKELYYGRNRCRGYHYGLP
jgi:hypothetical protein